MLEPVLTYRVDLPQGTDAHKALLQLRQLEEEDPQLHIVWNEPLREIHMQLMGEVQLEIAQTDHRPALRDGSGVWRGQHPVPGDDRPARWRAWATLSRLRHYAEVHLSAGAAAQRAAACQFATRLQRGLCWTGTGSGWC